MPFESRSLRLPGLKVIRPKTFGDGRGYFLELYKRSDFSGFGIEMDIVQTNHSCSSKGVLRGLHFQRAPMGQAKLITAMGGTVYDVAVDLREGSPTYGQWDSVELSIDTHELFYLPVGFAHGFVALSEGAHAVYYTDNVYSPEHEETLIWNDPAIGVDWPIANPILSEKDAMGKPLAEVESGYRYEG